MGNRIDIETMIEPGHEIVALISYASLLSVNCYM